MYRIQLRIEGTEPLAQRAVKCVHGTVPIGCSVQILVAHLHAHRCLRARRAPFVLLHDHREVHDLEWRGIPGLMALNE